MRISIRQTLMFCLMAVCALMPIAAGAISPKEVMQNSAAKIMRAPSMTVRFTATPKGGATTSGVLITAGRRFSMIGPDYGVWYNGQDLWSYSAATGETNLSTPTQAEILEVNPLDIVNNYAQNYTVKGKSSKETLCEVELTPIKKKGSAVKKAVITINTLSWLPTAMEVTFANGQKLKIDVVSSQIETRVPAATAFEYPASSYPGVPVIDLR